MSKNFAAAVAAVLRFPLRWGDESDGKSTISEVEDRGWYQSAWECAHHLAVLADASISTARAFGGEWPALHGKGVLVAPALPLVLNGDGGVGVDAAYTQRGGDVFREAAGLEEVYLTTGAAAEGPGRPFDLLWFGESERFTVRDGALEVEDLFARLELPAEYGLLERLLVRGHRVDPQVLDDVAFESPGAPATLTVHRAAVLHPDDGWRDPSRFLRARADIEGTENFADRIVAHGVTGARTVFECEDRDDGWSLMLESGEYLLTGFLMRRRGGALSLTATLHASLDPLAPGMRGRLAFDLRSDLVALS